MTVLFDKLGMSRKLEGEGKFTRLQAETLSDTLHDALGDATATKADLGNLKAELEAQIGLSEARMRAFIADVRTQILSFMIGIAIAAGIIQHFWK